MKLFHSSETRPVLGSHALFDGFLFFTGYHQATRGALVLSTEVADADIIDVEDLLHHEVDGNMRALVAEARTIIKRQHGIEITADQAEDLITQRITYEVSFTDELVDRDDFDSFEDFDFERERLRMDFELDSETGWKLQMLGARADRRLPRSQSERRDGALGGGVDAGLRSRAGRNRSRNRGRLE